MSFHNAIFRPTNEDSFYDHSHERISTKEPRRRINGFTIFCTITLIAWGIAIICKH